jgi:hypothetical protein
MGARENFSVIQTRCTSKDAELSTLSFQNKGNQTELSPDVHHAARGLQKTRLADVVTRLFVLYRSHDEVTRILHATTAGENAVQIMVRLGKKAGADLAV